MDIYKLTRKLQAARNAAQKQSEIADDISRELVQHINQRLRDNFMSLAVLSKRSGIPLPRLINWLSGASDHCLSAEDAATLWNAITLQKPSFTHQLKHLSEAEWKKDNATLAKEIGCNKEHVRLIRKTTQK